MKTAARFLIRTLTDLTVCLLIRHYQRRK